MKLQTTPLDGLWLAESELHEDSRGSFARIFCTEELKPACNNIDIAQINISKTTQVGTIRGMHFQHPPYTEVKMVRCIKGNVFDVAVDLREGSKTLLHWYGQELSAENLQMMIIPAGFAHGFQVLEENTELLYFHSNSYVPDCEGAIRFDEPRVNIKWPLSATNISKRDKQHAYLNNDFQGFKF
jgi:dTDP-4-dehydrorhamnose 3,5-epimerase